MFFKHFAGQKSQKDPILAEHIYLTWKYYNEVFLKTELNQDVTKLPLKFNWPSLSVSASSNISLASSNDRITPKR